MELLAVAYGDNSDGDGDDNSGGLSASRAASFSYRHEPCSQPPPPKRPRRGSSLAAAAEASRAPPVEFIAGRYVSKRERSMLAPSVPAATANDPYVNGVMPDSSSRKDILAPSYHQRKYPPSCDKPTRLSVSLKGHTGPVNSIHWSSSHGHLLASAGMDHAVFVWNVWSKQNTPACNFRFHNGAVKDVKWSPGGLSLLSGGFDCSLRLSDVEAGKEILILKEDQAVEAIKFHPTNFNVVLSGGSKGSLKLWDLRQGAAVKDYDQNLDTILDIEFSRDGKQFISSTDTTRSRVSENCIIVWDVSRQVPLSKQVYAEAFTCPCVRYHPHEESFVAQSNGNYIALFSARPPFKLNRYMRYAGHGVWGFPIKCNFSLDGKILASGSSDGSIYFYNYKTSKLLERTKLSEEACIDVAYHPVMPGVVACCSWNGDVAVFE